MSSKESSLSVVPWYNAAQFKKVYEYLYSEEITKMKWAVDAISIWETRCHPSLPVAIEATYVLISAVIQDFLWINKTTLVTFTDLQGIYGSAVTRFVSLIVEANKNENQFTCTMSEVARMIGISPSIVDIRNEWCHSIRPSLPSLRVATREALNYLKETYWMKEVALVNNYVKLFPYDYRLIQLFEDFKMFHEDTLKSIKTRLIKTDGKSKILDPEYKKLLNNLNKHLKVNKKHFVRVLTNDGIFIPSDAEFKRAVSKTEYALFDAESFLDDDCDDMSFAEEHLRPITFQNALKFETDNFPAIPDYHEDLWLPVIALLNKHNAVPLFMDNLLKSQGSRTVIGQKLIIAWMLQFLRIHYLDRVNVNSPRLKKIFRSKGIMPNWLSMLNSALINPCKYTLILLPLLLANVNLKVEETHRIIGLISLKLGLVPIENRKKNYHKLFHSASDLKQALENQRNSKRRDNQRKEMKPSGKDADIWVPCPDDCHKLWPIGYIVNAVKDTDNEEEEQIYECASNITSEMETNFDSRMLHSNKNEDDDEDDETCKMNQEPDLNKIMLEIEKRETLLYKRSG